MIDTKVLSFPVSKFRGTTDRQIDGQTDRAIVKCRYASIFKLLLRFEGDTKHFQIGKKKYITTRKEHDAKLKELINL